MNRQVSSGSAGDYQAHEQAGVTRLIWQQSSRRAGRCRAAQLAYIKQMSRQVSRASGGEYQADEQAGFEQLRWRLSGRRAGRSRAAHMETIKQMSRKVWRGQVAIIKEMSRQVSSSSAGDYQAEEQAGFAGLSWRLSSR